MKKIKTDPMGFMYQQDMYRSSVLPPPPHLNINHSEYFPRFSQEMNLIPNHMHPLPMNPGLNPPLTLNYNMNIYMPPFNYNYYPASFSLFNPMM